MITNFDAISMESLSLVLKIVTSNKKLVVMLDYGDDHHMLKKLVVGNHLNTISQATKRSPYNNHIPKSNVDSNWYTLDEHPSYLYEWHIPCCKFLNNNELLNLDLCTFIVLIYCCRNTIVQFESMSCFPLWITCFETWNITLLLMASVRQWFMVFKWC